MEIEDDLHWKIIPIPLLLLLGQSEQHEKKNNEKLEII